jgi:nicotinamidase-related amidase
MNLILDSYKEFDSLKECLGTEYNVNSNEKSVLFIVDMNNGFSKEGALYSKRVEAIIPQVVHAAELFEKSGLPIIATTDRHKEDSVEFRSYPIHCLENTVETEMVDELKKFGDKIKVIPKNSTNSFLEIDVKEIIDELIEKGFEKWVITGCCTDICILQFALTLRTYFNTRNITGEIIVPISAVETYDAPWHNADAMNLFSLYNMKLNGIKIVENLN